MDEEIKGRMIEQFNDLCTRQDQLIAEQVLIGRMNNEPVQQKADFTELVRREDALIREQVALARRIVKVLIDNGYHDELLENLVGLIGLSRIDVKAERIPKTIPQVPLLKDQRATRSNK